MRSGGALGEHVLRRLEELKELDDKVDFARSAVQLGVVLALSLRGAPMSADELAQALGERKKAVLDALRKLELKGLVAKSSGGEVKYGLSEEGKDYASKLLKLLEGPAERQPLEGLGEVSKRDLLKGLLSSQYLLSAIVALANAKGNAMELRKLAGIMGLSADRAKSYLDLLSRPPSRVFRRLVHPAKGVMYKLDKEGFEVYYRTRVYAAAKKNPLLRLKLRLYASSAWIAQRRGTLLAACLAAHAAALFFASCYFSFPASFLLSLLLLASSWLLLFLLL